jgi:hypothetical protein
MADLQWLIAAALLHKSENESFLDHRGQKSTLKLFHAKFDAH